MIGDFQILFLTKDMNSFEIQLSGRMLWNFPCHLLFHQCLEVFKVLFLNWGWDITKESPLSSPEHKIRFYFLAASNNSGISHRLSLTQSLLSETIRECLYELRTGLVKKVTTSRRVSEEKEIPLIIITSHLPRVLSELSPAESKVSKIMEMTRFGNVLKRNPWLVLSPDHLRC